jgi:plastocyanin domain-containing protein
VITRKTDQTCANEIVIDDPALKKDLPLNQPVTVAFTPKKTGELTYGCAMDKMIAGKIVVR